MLRTAALQDNWVAFGETHIFVGADYIITVRHGAWDLRRCHTFVDADTGISKWTLTGTTPVGLRLKVRGCDFYTFRDGMVVRKDSYWKIVA